MFRTLKSLKEKYQNSSSWKDLFLSLAGLENVYERLDQAKTDKERVGILTEALELQQSKLKELIEEIAKQKEQNEELENSNLEKDKEIARLKKSNDLSELKKLLIETNREAEEAERELEQTQALIEITTTQKITIWQAHQNQLN